MEKRMTDNNGLYLKSSIFGMGLGLAFGALIGAITGALSVSWNGILFCAVAGGIIGIFAGALTGALVVRTSGSTGGVSTGAYTGMAFGAFLAACWEFSSLPLSARVLQRLIFSFSKC